MQRIVERYFELPASRPKPILRLNVGLKTQWMGSKSMSKLGLKIQILRKEEKGKSRERPGREFKRKTKGREKERGEKGNKKEKRERNQGKKGENRRNPSC